MRYGVFGVSTWPIGAIPPPPFLSVSPLEYMRSRGAIPPPPPQKGYLSDTCAIPYEKANGCDTPLCDTISKGYCAIWGGISHWAAAAAFLIRGIKRTGQKFGPPDKYAESCQTLTKILPNKMAENWSKPPIFGLQESSKLLPNHFEKGPVL